MRSTWALLKNALKYHYAGFPTWCIFSALLILSLLAGIQHKSTNLLFMAGEIATNDVFAERTLKVEDSQATQMRREQTMALQPLLFDLDKKGVRQFRDEILLLLTSISSHGRDATSLANIQNAYNEKHQADFDEAFFTTLAHPEIQSYLTKTFLPFAENILLQGIFADRNQLTSSPTSVLIRDVELGGEALLIPNMNSLPDLSSFYLSLGQKLRSSILTNSERSVVLRLIENLKPPTLRLNKEETIKRATSVGSTIPPVYYYIQKGELIVSKDEIVTREQQLKMQALYKFSTETLNIAKSIGLFILSVGVTYGLFLSPTAATGSTIYPRAQLFIAFLILFFGLLAFLISIASSAYTEYIPEVWFFAFPVAGAAGLSSLVFSARRYLSIGLLLSLFATIFLSNNLGLFFFFFLSSMLSTLLILKSQNRQDVVRCTFVLLIFQYILGFGTALFNLIDIDQMPTLFLALTTHSILSLFLIFALSPLVEMFFGLTTRFRLMELMNLEQPLLQELMMSAPGTYHHSLIVSNLVEAGAKAVNANSLLCKVAALYHDVGKIVRPDYFIENQANMPNKHDTIAPAMSALIIISHVKQGIELAEKNHLGTEIIEIIAQHHGNRSIAFFYNKALQMHTGEGEPPKESDFSYPNSRPKSKEAAILMLADAIEASSRTLSDPTPARIESHVKKIVRGIYEEGQLDESELTFKDLNALCDAFIRILNGLFHQRIAYPDKKSKN